MIDRLCVIGVGLIGGSLAMGLRRAGYCRHVVGVGRNPDNLATALARGLIDEASHDIGASVSAADMIVIAAPVGATRQVVEQFAGRLKPDAVFTDVGSVKGSVVRQVEAALGGLPANFVPGHPIAGTENSGAAAAVADLYRGRRVLLTPLAETDPEAVARVEAMWRAVGAEVEQMPVERHDRILAATSHLPHMLAFGLVDSLARQEASEEIFRYAAGGFRDFTRIASSDPVMWRDICLHNRDALLLAMANYQADLDELKKAIEQGDEAALETIFSRAKKARDGFVH
ncbi:MAG TPA: prephenate dehydrogenase/arogenate dehydrogenase family protein [Gammaproteobacteria bacterium]|nr:prephenate dehydrogenase/arogenate dehydrogenase family protein [Gammaproteobacteria bacterium]